MKLTVTQDGEQRQIDVDLALSSMSLQEAVRLEEALGPDRWERLTENEAAEIRSPTVLQAIIWAKLVTHVPGIGRDEFDLDMGALAEMVEPESVVIPMSTEEGTGLVRVGKAAGNSGTG